MPSSSQPVTKALGRPRAFCADEALQAATRIFRRQGYQGASLSDLTAAMGINRPSCYAAFGDKEALFLKVLERYTHQLDEVYKAAFARPTAQAVARSLLEQTLAMARADALEPCLLAASAEPGEPLSNAIKASRQRLDRSLVRRLKRAHHAGDLPPHADPAALAGLLTMTLRGLVNQAAEGVGHAALRAQAETLLKLFAAKHVP